LRRATALHYKRRELVHRYGEPTHRKRLCDSHQVLRTLHSETTVFGKRGAHSEASCRDRHHLEVKLGHAAFLVVGSRSELCERSPPLSLKAARTRRLASRPSVEAGTAERASRVEQRCTQCEARPPRTADLATSRRKIRRSER